MMPKLLLLIFYLNFFQASYIYDEEDTIENSEYKHILRQKKSLQVEDEFEPVVNKSIDNIIIESRNLDCDDFYNYALNCTSQAADIYNSTKKSPPMPGQIFDWCRAIRHLTNCAIDWNTECSDFTDSLFNEESIKGHMHIVNNVCDNEWFLTRYDEVISCIEKSSEQWVNCYTAFKTKVDRLKNVSKEWTHYDSHFKLCCTRTQFRRCTLETFFENPSSKCNREEALTLQKFSTIVSDGEVFQDCDHYVLYENCPGGDPRPSGEVLASLMNAKVFVVSSTDRNKSVIWLLVLICLLNFIFI